MIHSYGFVKTCGESDLFTWFLLKSDGTKRNVFLFRIIVKKITIINALLSCGNINGWVAGYGGAEILEAFHSSSMRQRITLKIKTNS